MSGFITVKTSFDRFFKEPLLKRLIQDVVSTVTPILIHAQLFASYHVTRLLEAGQEVAEVNQTFFNRCIAAVTIATEGSQAFDSQGLADPQHHRHWTAAGQQFSELKTTLEDYHDLTACLLVDYNAAIPHQYKKLERPSVLKDVSSRLWHEPCSYCQNTC